MKLYKKAFGVISLGLLLSGTNLLAQEKSAIEVIKSAYANIGSMDKYAFDAVVVDYAMIDGKVKQFKHEAAVKIDRPGDLRVDTKGDIKNRTIMMHDGLFTMYDEGFDYYGQLKTPKNTDKVFDFLFDEYGIEAPLATLMYSDMGKRIKFKQSKYFGTRDLGGVECDYVAFKTKNKLIHVWITTGANPLVKAYSIIEGEDRINTVLTWDTNPRFSKNDFVFTAPKNAAKISINSAN